MRETKGKAEGLTNAGRDISEHRQAIAALKEEEAKFHALIQCLPAVTWVSDESGATTFISDNVEPVFGFTPEEFCRGGAALWLGRIHPDDRQETEDKFKALFRNQRYDVEYRFQHKDGRWVWVNDRSVSVFEQNGSKYARGVFFDITERKHAETLLHVQRELGVKLGSTSDVKVALEGLLEIAVQVGGIDCGGVRLVNEASGAIDLVAHRGFSAAFVRAIERWGADSPPARLIRQGDVVYTSFDRLPGVKESEVLCGEGLRAVAVIPLHHEGTLVGALVLASHTADEIAPSKRVALEAIAAQAAGAIARIQAEQSLRASEERYRTLAESSPDAIFILGRGSRVEYVNSAAAGLWGCTPQEMLGLGQTDLFPPEIARHQAEVVEGIFASGKSELREEAIPFPSGTRWLETRLTPIRGPDGSVAAVMGVTRDVTERKNAEILLQVQRDLGARLGSTSDLKPALEGLLQIAMQVGGIDCGGVYLVDEASGGVDLVAHRGVSAAFADAVAHRDAGSPQVRLMRQGQAVFTSFGSLPGTQNRAAQRDEGLQAIALIPLQHEGKMIGALVLASHTADDIPAAKRIALETIAAQATGAIGRIKAEQSLRASEHHHRRLIEVLPDAVAVLDLEGRIVSVNPRGAEMLGYAEPEQVLGKSVYDFAHAEDHERVGADLARLLQVRVLRDNEYRVVRQDGTIIPIETSATLIQDTKGQPTGSIIVVRSIAERKRAEKQRSAFAELGRRLSGETGAESTAATILDVAFDLFGWDAGYVHLYSRAEDKVVPLITVDTIQGQRTTVPRDSLQLQPTPLMRLIMDQGARLLNHDDPALQGVDLASFGDADRPSASRMYAPIHSGGAAIGVLSIQSYTLGAFSREDLRLFQGMADYCGDALERIKAVEAFHEAEASYRSIVENVPAGIFRTTPEGRIISANPALAQMFGYQSPEEMMSSVTNIAEQLYVLPERRAEFQKLIQTQSTVEGFEVENYRKDGSRIWISTNARAVRDATGALLYFEGTNHDITERRRAEESLRRSQELQQTILENISDPAWLKDTHGRFLACNGALAKFLGYPKEQVLGKTMFEVAPFDAAQVAFEDSTVMELCKPSRFEVRRRDARGGFRWFEMMKAPILGADGGTTGIVGVGRDVTERKRYEKELLRLPRRIIETQEGERQRVARELHDSVNQILASIRMRLGRIGDASTGLGPSSREVLKRCQGLLVQAIEENRRIAHDLRPTDLDQLGFTVACRNFCKQFAARSNLTVKCNIGRFGKRLPSSVELNLYRIVQEAFSNLERHARAKTVRLRITVHDRLLHLKIADDGCGFDPAAIAAGKKKPSGLGLVNIQERAAAMRGACEIDSTAGHGTTIVVTVPLKARE